MKKILALLVVMGVVVGGGLGFQYWRGEGSSKFQFRTVAVERGDLLATVKATGPVQPEEVVNVGTQVAGQILSFGRDPRDSSRVVDYGSPVEAGTVLAQIDDAVYRSDVEQAKALVRQNEAQLQQTAADVQQAKANVERAEADLVQLQARSTQSEHEWKRNQQVSTTPGLITQSELDLAEANFLTAQAAVAVGKAAINQAKAQALGSQAMVIKAQATLEDSQASLKRAEINLGYCVIRSPVKGVIFNRLVGVGQTVVSSFNTPSLFLIAKDLSRMQVLAAVNEADIGQVHSGQAVNFTVDAQPGKVFHGVVAPDQPRLYANVTQNVVSYTVVVNVDNAEGKLLPNMTASAEFEVDRRSNVVQIPNIALRWRPSLEDQVVPSARDEWKKRQQRASLEKPAKRGDQPEQRTVWVEDHGQVRPVRVRIGLTDGTKSEVTGELKPEDQVVVGEIRNEKASSSSNPLAPPTGGGGGRRMP